MGSVPSLLTFLPMNVSGWVHRHQLIVIEFLQAENRMLKERLRGKRIRFTDAERALLVARNNSHRGLWGAGRLQSRANSGMMRACGTWCVQSRVCLPMS
jgi:hypothetical protein